MEILKSTNRAKDFYPYSRRINGSILKCVPIDATKKIRPMALSLSNREKLVMALAFRP